MDVRQAQRELDDLLGADDPCLSCKCLTGNKKSYAEVLTLALDIGLQYELLERLGLGLLDIPRTCIGTTARGRYRLDLSQLEKQKLLVPVVDGNLFITRRFTLTDQMAPELRMAFRLPATCLPTVALHSLKTLCVWQLGMEHDMALIYGTKLFYLLERCGRIRAQERLFLYI